MSFASLYMCILPQAFDTIEELLHVQDHNTLGHLLVSLLCNQVFLLWISISIFLVIVSISTNEVAYAGSLCLAEYTFFFETGSSYQIS